MKIKVVLERQGKEIKVDVKEGSSVKDLLEEVNKKEKVNPTEVIFVKDDRVVTESEELEEGDEIKFLSVISGG